jgi:hypothetical protein
VAAVPVEPADVLVEDVLERIVAVDAPEDRRDVVDEPAPRGVRGVELAHERVQVVDRRAGVVAATGRAPRDGVEPVREGRARHGAEPPVADAELGREVVVDGQEVVGVVAHHVGGVHLGRPAPLLVDPALVHVDLDEAAVLVLELVVDRLAAVRRVLRLLHLRGRELVHRKVTPSKAGKRLSWSW